MKCSRLLEDSLLEQIKENKKIAAAVVALGILFALAVALLTVPQALGTNQNSQPKDVVGVGQKQAHLEDQLNSYEAISDENLDQIVEPAQKDSIELAENNKVESEQTPAVKADAKSQDKKAAAEQETKAAADKKAQEAKVAEAKQKAEAEKKAQDEAAAKAKAAADKKAQEEAKQKELEAEKAVAQAVQQARESKAEPKNSNASDWSTVTASMYYGVGNKTATGKILQSDDMIIAHKTLPFGTKVEIEYNGKVAQATVGDRGPYVKGRQIDLAPGVQNALGINDGVVKMNMRIVD